MTLFLTALCALAVFIASRSFGRIAGVSAAAACGVSIAFFAMEPVFSFEIARSADRGTLFAYGVAAFLMVVRHPRRESLSFPHLARPLITPLRAPETDFVHLLQAAAARTWPGRIELDIDPRMRIPGTGEELEPALTTIMNAGVPDVVPVRIAAYSGTVPGHCLIWIALQYKPWPHEPHVVRSGRRADLCAPLEVPNPAVCSVSWFDNGFERVFQIRYRLSC